MITMAILKIKEIRNLTPNKIDEKIKELKLEFMKQKGKVDVGGVADNPGKLNEIKKTIARLKTIKKEMN
jgi:large subunit ribosomal protein L29